MLDLVNLLKCIILLGCREVQRDVELDVILLIYWEYKPIININTSP
jgi:hypothetical protein